MIYLATKEAEQGNTIVYFSKNRKTLKDMGFRWITTFDSEHKAIMWANESFMFNTKEYLYD
ncbi:hypothetical protein [Eisenibacter elegans]|jgi:hypothetical protein|uniref:hypothetical protein n=1 Tax=Eisenibacter elegans TaxID=997 RepID=UPI00041A8846|nr:hypothetical protein [Eisenibacter elegans]